MVEITPSVIAPVCHTGDQLELRCTSPGVLLTWQVTATAENGAPATYTRSVTSVGPSGLVNSQPLTINSTIVFTFSRLSSRDDLPLVSGMTINSVSEGLNGVAVNCTDVSTTESATSTIHIIGGRL